MTGKGELTPTAPATSSSHPSSDSTVQQQQQQRRPYTAFARSWMVPGTIASAAVGATVGGGLAAFYNRPLFRSTQNVAVKFGLSSFLYLGTLGYLSEKLPEEYAEKRFATHVASGAATGFLLGGLTGRIPGAIRGVFAGVALAVPAYFALEGRHYLSKEPVAVSEEKK